jgi:serine/threonine-protein kinase RsbT
MERHPNTAGLSTGTVPLRDPEDVAICRQVVRMLAHRLDFSTVGNAMIVTAASELARNTIVHGAGGEVVWTILHDENRRGLQLAFQDHGPGIVDLKLAMTDGWTSAGGLGLGLPGAKRLVHKFRIDSVIGGGTRVVVIRWR